uniref:Uncharacterized protein n=1 Tax=Caenorhabditis japonica TaxID=281687 RepID=A0A8R1IK26_CAEJA
MSSISRYTFAKHGLGDNRASCGTESLYETADEKQLNRFRIKAHQASDPIYDETAQHCRSATNQVGQPAPAEDAQGKSYKIDA